MVTTRGEGLDFSVPLFASGAGFLVTSEEAPEVPVPTVRAGHQHLDLRAALGALGAEIVHCEGGPRLNGTLVDAGLIDEVNLTVSPALAGGTSARIVAGAGSGLRRMRLTQLMEEDGFLFCRYLRQA